LISKAHYNLTELDGNYKHNHGVHMYY